MFGVICLKDKKHFTIRKSLYTVYKHRCICIQLLFGGMMQQDFLLECLKLQRIDFFIKLVAASECNDEEKHLAIQWVSELTDELMAKIRSHEYSRSMDIIN